MKKSLLDLAREIQALSQSGLTFSRDPHDIERYERLRELSAELLANQSQYSREELGRLFSAEMGYATPKLDVRAAVFSAERLLLVRERSTGHWTLPGGYVDVGESLGTAAEREVLEETGLGVRARKLAAIFDHRRHGYKPHLYHFHKAYLLCERLSGEARPTPEVSEVGMFTCEEAARLSFDAGRATAEHVLRMFDHHETPSLPTDFD